MTQAEECIRLRDEMVQSIGKHITSTHGAASVEKAVALTQALGIMSMTLFARGQGLDETEAVEFAIDNQRQLFATFARLIAEHKGRN
jgi:hypothetical protein